jgi:hypothetical protein
MIVSDLDVVSVVLSPDKTNPVLVINSDAVLSATASPQFLQAVAGREPQIIEHKRRVKHGKFPFRRGRWKRASRLASSPDFRRTPVGETLDHC